MPKADQTQAAPILARRNGGNMLNLQTGHKTEFYEVTDTGIYFLSDGMPVEEWLKLAELGIGDFESSRDSHLSAMFRVGDILARGEREYAEQYAQAIDSTRKAIRLSVSTLRNVAWIAGSIPPENRHPLLTLSHHEKVARLPADEQKTLLDKAEEEEISAADLAKKVRELHPPKQRGAVKGKKVSIDLDSESGCLKALEKIVDFIEKLTTNEEDENKHPADWTEARQAKWFPPVTRLFAALAPAEEIAREGAKEVASYLNSPDAGKLSEWIASRKKKWAATLAELAKAGRRMGVTAQAKGGRKKQAAEPGE